jgi:hypothetical protein
MSPGLSYAARVPNPRKHSASSAPGPHRRRVGRRALNVLALLLLVVLPLQGSIQDPTSAATPQTAGVTLDETSASRAARTPKVFIKLAKHRVSTGQRARVKVALSVKGTRSAVAGARQSPSAGSGRIKVVAKGGGKSRPMHARLKAGKATVALPRLPRGVYRVRAVFLGNAMLGKAKSEYEKLTVGDVGGGPSGFPNAGNTGVPAGVTLKAYGGPCTITADNTVIDSKSVGCSLQIQAKNVVIRNSSLKTVWLDQDIMHAQGKSGWSVSVTDSEVDGGTTDGPGVCCGNYSVLRVEMRGGHNGAQCENGASYCNLTDSWIHSQYEPAEGLRHLGGFLNDGGTPSTLIHNSITCDAPAENNEGGCTGDINLIPNFGVMANVTVTNNFLGANANSAYCTYGGGTPGLESYAQQSNNIVYRDNVFERADTIANPSSGQPGRTKRCAAYGPVVGFDVDGSGNVWTGNHYDDGTAIICNASHRCD